MSAVIVLQPGAQDAVEALAEERGWTLTAQTERRHGAPKQRAWDVGAGHKLVLFFDHRLEIHAVEVIGESAKLVADALRPRLTTFSVEALQKQTEAANPRRALAGLRGLTWAEWVDPSPETLAAAERLLRHRVPAVSAAAVNAVAVTRWEALTPTLEALLEEVDDPGRCGAIERAIANVRMV